MSTTKPPEVKAAEEADRAQLVEALAEHPGTPWGEAIEKVATLRLEHDAWGAVIDGLRASLATVTRERDELRAALLNERGEGEPPSEGWRAITDSGFNLSWQKSGGPRGVIVVRRTVPWGWRYDFTFESGPERQHGNARDVMRAADAALAGGKS